MPILEEEGRGFQKANLEKLVIQRNFQVIKPRCGLSTATDVEISATETVQVINYLCKNIQAFPARFFDVVYEGLGIQGAKILLDKNNVDINVNQFSSTGGTALQIAYQRGDKEMVQVLLRRGANINKQNRLDGSTCVHLAAEKKELEMLQLLHKKRANFKLTKKDGTTAIHIACEKNEPALLHYLLSLGLDVNVSKKDGNTPFLIACAVGNFELLNVVLQKMSGAQGGEKAILPLAYSSFCSTPHIERVFEIMIKLGININEQRSLDGYSVLHQVCEKGDEVIFSKLMELQATVNSLSNFHETPLLLAFVNQHKKMVDILLEAGADVNTARTTDGTNVLHVACERGDLAMLIRFVEKGGDVLLAKKDNTTTLHIACSLGNYEMVKLLLAFGVDCNAKTIRYSEDDSETPLSIARKRGDQSLVRLLCTPMPRFSSLEDYFNYEKQQQQREIIIETGSTQGKQTIHGECSVCSSEEGLVPLDQCLHSFCLACLRGWLTVQFDDGSHIACCPQKGCKKKLTYFDLFFIFTTNQKNDQNEVEDNENEDDSRYLEKYEEKILERYLLQQKDFRWCPNGCGSGGFVFSNSSSDCKSFTCAQCSFAFCSECLLESHELSCNVYFQRKVEEEIRENRRRRAELEGRESQKWIVEKTKPCPKCSAPTEKDGGCSHMLCKRCGYEYCFICRGPYQGRFTTGTQCPCP